MEIKVVELHLKGNNVLEICRLLDLKYTDVLKTVSDFQQNPYFIRHSQSNHYTPEKINEIIAEFGY